ncbi:MAG TPA: hypothetical protein VN428_23820, partial [Bryobacteraceae bacterium]|nr:hypothetical protein [Bryobacteraceae bacterium]
MKSSLGVALALASVIPLHAQPRVGENRVTINGREWAVEFIPAMNVPAAANTGLLFLAGASDWQGPARPAADAIAHFGYNVFRIDPAARPTPADIAALATWSAGRTGRKLMLGAWGKGASPAILAAGQPKTSEWCPGLVLIAAAPDPVASAALVQVSIPLLFIQSATGEQIVNRLATAVGGPKRVMIVPATDDNFGGGQAVLFESLRSGLA